MRISDWSSDVCSSDLTSCLSPQDSPCLKVDGNLLTAVPVGIVRNESRDLGNLLRVDASHRAESPKITFIAEVPGDGHHMALVDELNDSAIKFRRVGVNQIGRASCRDRECQKV